MNLPLLLKSIPFGGRSFGPFICATGLCSQSDQTVAQIYSSEKVITERLSGVQAAPARRSSVMVPDQPSRFISITVFVMVRRCMTDFFKLMHMIKLSSGDHLICSIVQGVWNLCMIVNLSAS